MKKIIWTIPLLVLATLVFSAKALGAKPDLTPTLATVEPSDERAIVVIPKHATEVTPGVFKLGPAVDKGEVVEGYAFIHYKEGFGKPTGCNNDGVCQGWEDSSCVDCTGGGGEEPDDSTCYGFLSKGAKWKIVEDYMVDPTNTRGLDETVVRDNLAFDIDKWEDAADGEVDGTITKDILGDEIAGVVDGADLDRPDEKNEVYFADISSSGAIGVTIIWGVFRGPPSQRKLVEWDQVYDDVDFDWSSSGETGKMDFENIATHELGHSVGLDDLYNSSCVEQTMYGYSDYGETKKRTLEAGDIAGVQELYSQ